MTDDDKRRAHIALDEHVRVAAMWTAGSPVVDIWGLCYKPRDEPWCVRYRFRWHRDNLAFNSADRKEWYRLDFADQSDAGVRQACEHFHAAMTEMVRECGLLDFKRDDVNGSGLDAFAVLQRNSSAHVKYVGGTGGTT